MTAARRLHRLPVTEISSGRVVGAIARVTVGPGMPWNGAVPPLQCNRCGSWSRHLWAQYVRSEYQTIAPWAGNRGDRYGINGRTSDTIGDREAKYWPPLEACCTCCRHRPVTSYKSTGQTVVDKYRSRTIGQYHRFAAALLSRD